MKKIIFGLTADYKPFSYYENNILCGLDVDIAHLISKELNIEIDFFITTWSDLLKDFKNKKFNIAIGGIAINEERTQEAYFSKSYILGGKTPVGLTSKKESFNTFDKIDQKDNIIIVNKGGTNEKFVNQCIVNAKIIKKETNHDIFDFILNNEADIMFTDSMEAIYMEKTESKLCRTMPDILYSQFEIAFMIEKNQYLLNSINQVFKKYHNEINELKKQYKII